MGRPCISVYLCIINIHPQSLKAVSELTRGAGFFFMQIYFAIICKYYLHFTIFVFIILQTMKPQTESLQTKESIILSKIHTANHEGVFDPDLLERAFFSYICTAEFAEKERLDKENLVHQFQMTKSFLTSIKAILS